MAVQKAQNRVQYICIPTCIVFIHVYIPKYHNVFVFELNQLLRKSQQKGVKTESAKLFHLIPNQVAQRKTMAFANFKPHP